MALLDGFIETTQADLPGQEAPEPQSPSPPPLRPSLLLDEAYLVEWRAAALDEFRSRAKACLMDTFDRKNAGRGGKGASPALQAARVAFEARVRDADQATLIEMLAWAEPKDKHFVFQGLEAVADRFMADSPAPPARMRP
jgi:hypothetical protein